jgi:tRNA(Ile)-lysidine synthase
MASSRSLLPDGSVQLVRPLLGLSKARLVATLNEADRAWLDDPSNERLDFERVRLRAAQVQQAALGLSNEKLALSASRLMRARDALDKLTDEKLGALVDVHDGVFASLHREAWEREPAEIRVRLLARLLGAFGGEAKPAQLSQVEALEAILARGRPFSQTLGGCIVSQGLTTLRLYREPGHHDLPEVPLRPGEEALWDWRFRIRYDDEGEDGDQSPLGPVSVRPLGLSAYATLRGGLAPNNRPPARAAAGLPSIWSGDRLLAAPALPGCSTGNGRFSAVFLGLDRLPK